MLVTQDDFEACTRPLLARLWPPLELLGRRAIVEWAARWAQSSLWLACSNFPNSLLFPPWLHSFLLGCFLTQFEPDTSLKKCMCTGSRPAAAHGGTSAAQQEVSQHLESAAPGLQERLAATAEPSRNVAIAAGKAQAPTPWPAPSSRYEPPPRRITRVAMVGGASRMPAVQRLVAEASGIASTDGPDPELAVALGAAVYAGILLGKVPGEFCQFCLPSILPCLPCLSG